MGIKGLATMKKIFLHLRIWYYRRWFTRTLDKRLKQVVSVDQAIDEACKLFEWRFLRNYHDMLCSLFDEVSNLRNNHIR